MCKNYFTDEQVREMVKKSEILFEHRNKSYMDKLKAIMNQAVEAVIGEPVAWYKPNGSWNDGFVMNESKKMKHINTDLYTTPLYSVKELEN